MTTSSRGVWQRMTCFLGRNQNRESQQEKVLPLHQDENHTQQVYDSSSSSLFIIFQNDSKKECREKLQRSFSRNNVIWSVKEEDFIPGVSTGDDDDEVDDDSCRGQLILPRSETEYGTATVVPNCCVICLESYRAGDLVVWSSNSECQHVMHEACVVKYLVRIHKKVGMTPCCVCRRNFTDLKVEREEQPLRRRGGGRRRTVRTNHNFEALALPSWCLSLSAAARR